MGACQIHSPCGMQMQQEHWLWCWWQCIPIILVLCRGGGLFLLLGRHGDRMPHAPGSNLFPDSRYECGAKWHTKSQPGGVQERVLKGDWWNYNSTWRQDYKAEFQFQPLRSQSGISQKPGLCMDWFVIVAEPFVLGSKPSKPCCGVWNRPSPIPRAGVFLQQSLAGLVPLHWPWQDPDTAPGITGITSPHRRGSWEPAQLPKTTFGTLWNNVQLLEFTRLHKAFTGCFASTHSDSFSFIYFFFPTKAMQFPICKGDFHCTCLSITAQISLKFLHWGAKSQRSLKSLLHSDNWYPRFAASRGNSIFLL